MVDKRKIGAIEIDRLYDFLDGLQASGYTLDPRQYLILSDLLMALIGRGDSLDELPLKTLIAPLICSTPAEQQDFYQRFDRWYPTLIPVKQASLSGDGIALPPSSKRRLSLPTINRTAVIWSTVVVAVITLIVWLISNLAAIGTQVINSTTSLYGITLAIFGFIVWLGWRASILYQENQYITRELANQEPVYTKVPVKAYIQDVIPVMQFKPIVSSLRKRTQLPSADVDVDRTIENALSQNNWLEIVYRQRQVMPEYVVLIDRKGRLDQQARFVQEVLAKIEADGVWLHQYEYSGDPRVCFQFGRKDTPLSLKDLQSRHPNSRLLVFSSTSEFINPLTGLLQDWIESLSYWQERAILTPDILQKSLLEELESHDFAILPMSFDGLASLVRAFETDNVPFLTNSSVGIPARLIERPVRWTGRHKLPDAEVKALIEDVKNYLGDNGFYWLCATAVYPELRWELTLYLGSAIHNKNGEFLLNPENLLRLTHLPWFRLGYMPDWFRLALISSMSESEDSEVRGILGTLLESAFQTKDNLLDLQIATKPSVSLSERSRKMLRILFSGQSTESELHDYIFLRFLLKKDQKQLAVLFNRLSNRLGSLFELLDRIRVKFNVWQQTRELSRKSKFYWQEPSEVIYYTTRMHPIALYQELLKPILLFAVPAGIFSLWTLFSLSNLILIAVWALVIVILLWITWQVQNWLGMYFIITNQRVVWTQSLFGALDIREESPLTAILSVSVEADSLERQLEIGDVVIRTLVGKIRFDKISNPDDFARMVEVYWGEAKEQSVKHEKELMRDAIRTKLELKEQAAIEKARLEDEEIERQRIVREKSEYEAAEKARAEQAAIEKARLEAEEAERQRLVREKSERESTEKARRIAGENEKAIAKLSREQKNIREINNRFQETEITIWGPTQSGKDWLLKGFAKELEEHTLRSENFIFELRERQIGGTNFSHIIPEPPRILEPTPSAEDYILSFTRKIKLPDNNLSSYTHYINFHNNRGSDLISAILEPDRFDYVISSIVRSQYIMITLDPSFNNKESIPNINGIDIGNDYPLASTNSGLNKENYFKILTLFLDNLANQNSPKKYLAICITKTDLLKTSRRNSWELLELIFGQKIFRLFNNYRSVFNMEVFATSAAGYVTRKGNYISNFSNGKLLDYEKWRPFNCAAPFFWLFENKEIEIIKSNSNFLNRETNLRNYIRYPRPHNL